MKVSRCSGSQRILPRLAAALGMFLGVTHSLGEVARADAMFTASVDSTLTITSPAVLLEFSYTTPPGTSRQGVDRHGNASGIAGTTAAVIPASFPALIGGGVEGLSIASGKAAPDGWVTAGASTIGQIRLKNLTGNSIVNPPGMTLTETLNLDYSFSLSVKADAGDNEAEASVRFDLISGGTTIFSEPPPMLLVVGAGQESSSMSGSVSVEMPLPANSTTPIFLETQVYGFAESRAMAAPEPGSACLLVAALPCGLVYLARRRRRRLALTP
jgi:hypothetical protein